MWRGLWAALLLTWWVVATVGVVLSAALVAQAKHARESMPQDWRWSRILVDRNLRIGRARAVIFTAYFVAAPAIWEMFTLPAHLGATGTAQLRGPVWLLVLTAAIWVAALIALMVLTLMDVRQAGQEDPRG